MRAKEQAANFLTWYMFSAKLVGIPLVGLMCLNGLSKLIFTGMCVTVGSQCQFSGGTEHIMSKYLMSLVS